MLKTVRLLSAMAAALIVMAVAAGVALGDGYTISPAGEIAAISAGKITFAGEGAEFSCNMTMNGTLTRAEVANVSGTRIGSVTGARTSECSTREVNVLIPNSIVHVALLRSRETVIGILIAFEEFGVLWSSSALLGCLMKIRLMGVLGGVTEEGRGRRRIATLRILEEPLTTIVNLGFLACPIRMTPRGSFNLSPTQSITYIP